MIRLTCSDRDNKITLDFSKNFTDRDAIRDVLNRLQSQGGPAVAAPPSNGASSGGSSGERSSPHRAPPPTVAPVSAEERARRARLLQRKEVVKLHAKLVRSGAVRDEEFWRAMNYRYTAKGERRARGAGPDVDEEEEMMQRAGQRGVPSDAFASGTSGGADAVAWAAPVPSAAERHRVFMQHPSVANALAAKVPAEMEEAKFWETFRQSSLAGRKRGSGPGGRLSKLETILTAEADGMFAPFQAGEGEMEKREREKRVKGLARSLDLGRFDDHRTAHVLEGHVVGGDAPRPMKRQRGRRMPVSSELKLMQMVNRHGALVVQEGAGGSWREGGELGRPLEDLQVEEEAKFAKLGVGAASAGVAGGGRKRKGGEGATVGARMAAEMHAWDGDVGRMRGGVDGCAVVLQALLQRMRP